MQKTVFRFVTGVPVQIVFIVLLLINEEVFSEKPEFELEFAKHNVNQVGLMVSNFGEFGASTGNLGIKDVFTGEYIFVSSDFPLNSGLTLVADVRLWFGGVVGNDTLVSSDIEWNPDSKPFGGLSTRSSLSSSDYYSSQAISEEDILAHFADTFTFFDISSIPPDEYTGLAHKPLWVSVQQNSYAWSGGHAEDVILFDIKIKNLSRETIEDAYFGVLVVPNVSSVDSIDVIDDLSGFIQSAPVRMFCDWYNDLGLVWSVDNDGDPQGGQYHTGYPPPQSNRHALGIRFLGYPETVGKVEAYCSFNWWHYLLPMEPTTRDYGPQHQDSYRDFHTGGLGEPRGDVGRYHLLSNGEIDPAMPFTATLRPEQGWILPTRARAEELATGETHNYLLSVGPFDMPPGGVLPVGFAYIGGENVHRNPDNFQNLPLNPSKYMDNLDFTDLIDNAVWAEWIYDNPGVDTDGDGYAGETHICVHDSVLQDGQWVASVAETLWVKGDGIPDWRAAAPPPAPDFWLNPIENGIHVRFNGQRSETEIDVFSRIVDFEGYRVYLGRDTRRENMAVVASYDIYDFDQWVFRPDLDTFGVWQIQSIPFTLDSLRCLYGHSDDPCNDMSFDPLSTAAHKPYRHPDYPESTFFFTPHEYNASEFGFTTPITKIYPDAPDPSLLHPDSIPEDYYTEDGYLKFYEYEFTIENLLPTVPYYVNVTAFDFGSPKGRLEALETSNTLGAKEIYPLAHGASSTASGDLYVLIYPNPYRIDGGYRDSGYEGRMREDRADNRVREVHFANLPPKCTISIYTLDGDLVRSIDHDIPQSDPNHTHDSWDLITRNTQEPVSGLYYWVVEASDGRTQIGKLVLIM